MDLIERYLGAVRWNLPGNKADDIIAELADLIAARIEDREEALDRPLDRAEISALLREFGHPLAVAGRYHGQRALIDAEVFPFYWFALKVMLALILVIELIQYAGRFLIGRGNFAQILAQGMNDTIHSLLVNAAIVTLLFAVIERTGWLDAYLARWKPEELPDLSSLRAARPAGLRRHGPWQPLFEIAFAVLFLCWWTGAVAFDWIPHDARIVIHAAPIWQTLYWPVIALVGVHIAQGLVALLRPRWKPLRGALMLGSTAGIVALCAVLRQAGRVVTVSGSDIVKAAEVQNGIDRGFAIAVVVIALIAVCQCAVELWQLYRER